MALAVVSDGMKLFAEFMGSAALMLSILASGYNPIIVGLTLAVLVFLLGGISGCVLNPAIGVGFWYSGSLSNLMFVLYTLVEVLGALAAAYAYRIVG